MIHVQVFTLLHLLSHNVHVQIIIIHVQVVQVYNQYMKHYYI